MNLIRFLLFFAVLTMIVSPSAAAIVEEVHCSYVEYQPVPYDPLEPRNHTIPLFDPGKGILLQVDVNFSVNGSQYVGYENTQDFGFDLETSAYYELGVTLFDGYVLKSAIRNNRTNNVSAFVNLPPIFAPPDGFNFTTSNFSLTSTLYTDCQNLLNFTATTPGETKIFLIASTGGATYSPDYQANRIIEVATRADTWMCVKYTYDDSKLNITKTGNTSGPAGVDDTIEYDIQVCNPATVTVYNVTVRDSLLSGSPFSIGTLNSSACKNVTVSLNYTVTADDVCRGWVNNTANATGDAECGYFIDTDKNATWNVSASYNSSINVTKTANTSGTVGLGEVIEYYIRVCNTGNITVYNVTVNDSLTGGPYTIGSLTPGQCRNVTPNPTYTVTVDDVCFGWVNNTANAAGIDYCGDPVETEANASLNVTAAYNSSINITKTANTSGPVALGDEVEYTITVCNTGNVTVYNVTVEDNRTGTHKLGVLNVSECKSWYPIYIVTQQDICNGSVNNSANATGEDICGKPVSAGPATFNVSTEYNSSINITKVANTSGPVAPGDLIEYTITVCNTGTLTVDGVVVHDNRTGDLPIGTINVSQCVPVTAIYTVTELDICNGSVNNSAYAAGYDYCGKPVGAGPATFNVSTEYNSSINVTKVANTSGPVAPGDEIEYTITVCNSGNLTLNDVTVSDNRTGEYIVGRLGKGQCNVTRQTTVVTEGDLCRPIVNIVEAIGLDFCGNTRNDTDSTSVETVCYHCISGHKYWDKDGDGTRDPEDPPLENWTIQVKDESGLLLNETTTDENGYWEICKLVEGEYNVSEVVLDGWKPTNPAGGYRPVVVASDDVTGIDFLNTGIYCISGHKYWDKDGDGVVDSTDEPLPNWTIFIDEDGDRIADPREPVTTTGGDGLWEICNLPPGTYTVCEELVSGWLQTCPQGSDCYSVEIIHRSATCLEFLNYRHERWNEGFIKLGNQTALAWDMSYVDGLAKNKIEIDKTQTQSGCGSGDDLFNFGNITVEDQSADSTGPGTSGNEITIVTSQS